MRDSSGSNSHYSQTNMILLREGGSKQVESNINTEARRIRVSPS
jgi:hypothetical protein